MVKHLKNISLAILSTTVIAALVSGRMAAWYTLTLGIGVTILGMVVRKLLTSRYTFSIADLIAIFAIVVSIFFGLSQFPTSSSPNPSQGISIQPSETSSSLVPTSISEPPTAVATCIDPVSGSCGPTSPNTCCSPVASQPATNDSQNGRDGRDGLNGRDGYDGLNGQDGRDGRDGQDGQAGEDGQDGQEGHNGLNGQDGQDGLNGQDGQNGEEGHNGLNGQDGQDGLNGQDVSPFAL